MKKITSLYSGEWINKVGANKVNWIQLGLFALILCILSTITYKNTITAPPQGIHAWSQSDHYAIAMTYAEHGLNFFLPRSYVLNPPMVEPKTDTLEGITRVDFPLGEYVSGCIMKITGSVHPVIYRICTLIISLIGLCFLYKLVKSQTQSFLSGLLSAVFIFSMPVYMYYQSAMAPSTSATGLCFIGYYFYFTYLSKKEFKYFIFAILFFLIAILFRLPFAIALIAVFCQQCLYYFYHRKIKWKEVFVFLSVVALLLAYTLYNTYLSGKYGSIFLTSWKNPSSIDDFKETLYNIFDHQYRRHMVDDHKWCLCVLGINLITFIIFAWKKKQRIFTSFQKQILLQSSIGFIGGSMYFIIMLKQYIQHDYYFIDTFLVSFTLFLVFLFSFIRWEKFYINWGLKLTCLVLMIIAYTKALPKQSGFYQINYAWEQNFDDMNALIKKHHIGKDKTIAIPDFEFNENVAFCRIQRYGFCTTGEHDLRSRKWIKKSDFIMLTEKSLIDDVIPTDSSFVKEIEYIDKHNTVLLFKYRADKHPLSTYSENCDTGVVKLSSLIFSIPDQKNIHFFKGDDDSSRSDQNPSELVFHVVPDDVYGNEVKFSYSEIKSAKKILKLTFMVDIMPIDDAISPYIVFSNNGTPKFYQIEYLENYTFKPKEWNPLQFQIYIPNSNKDNNFSCFYWNVRKNDFYYKNWKIYIE